MRKRVHWGMDTATDLIRQLRAAGLSQSEIARRTGNTQSSISRWEAGFAPAGADAALRLAALAKEISSASPNVTSQEAANV